MAEPADEIAPDASGHGRLKASGADREQVVWTLKAGHRATQHAQPSLMARKGRGWPAVVRVTA